MAKIFDRLKTLRNWAAGASTVALLSACALSPEADAAAIERDILETPGAGVQWQAIKEEFPQEFAQLVSQIQALDMSERRQAGRVAEVGTIWLKDFFVRVAPDAVRAPDGQLIAWSSAESEFFTALQASSEGACANYTMGDWIEVDERDLVTISAMARRNAAMVRAAAAGRRNPQAIVEPSDAAFGQLGDAIAATGLAPHLQATLGSDSAMRALSVSDQCAIGVAVYQGLSDLPDDIEPVLAAYMFAPEG